MQSHFLIRSRHWIILLSVGLVLLSGVGVLLYWKSASARTHAFSRTARKPTHEPAPPAVGDDQAAAEEVMVELSRAQQQAIGLKVVSAADGITTDLIEAPGQVVPDESKFAYITPRAGGVVRSVAGRIGLNVKAGDLLAMIDSPEISKARFELYTQLQELEIARTQAEWHETTFKNTTALIERLKAGDSPEEIHRRFQERSLGANREQVLTAYAAYRLSSVTMERNQQLIAQGVITPKQFQQVRAEFESAQATYQGLMDQMEYNTRLANVRAQQTLRRDETAVRVARERLRVLGVKPDGTEPEIKEGKVVGVRHDGTLQAEPARPADRVKPEPILAEDDETESSLVMPVGSPTEADTKSKDLPVSAYAIWAPFDGTILDRELIVPGVFVDTTHRIFTLADLTTVWVEVNIHEGRYGALGRSHDAAVSLTTPAYPGRTFPAEVIYTGDLVDPKSRTIKLLARAANADRELKPGMFVDVQIRLKGSRNAILVPESAILTEDDHHFVFVRTGPEQFVRRRVVTGASDGNQVPVFKGLEAGEDVVVEGAFKLKSRAFQLSGLQP
jgi:multidrug efflux pump subunit AcrA (membrane-fusion protein)